MNSTITINGRRIGSGEPTYIIAELSANHNQDFEQAVEIIKAAHKAGADAVKLQTYTPDTMTIRSSEAPFTIGKGTIWEGYTLYDLYAQAYTPWEWQPRLKEIANSLGLDLFSTPFDLSAIEFLENMDVPAHKIASFELVDLPFVEQVARTGKPIILSTGMASLAEIDEAVRTIRAHGNDQIALLKCTSAYPATPDEMNLRTIGHLSDTFGVPAGLSDHSPGWTVAVAAVSVGASIVEKHLTLSRSMPGPDSAFSLEPEEFKAMVEAVRIAEKALGTICYGVTKREEPSLAFRRSLFVVKDMKKGELFSPHNLRSIRPGNGLSPKYYETILGKPVNRDTTMGTPVSWDLVG